MATGQAVATVVAVTGHAFARDAQGNLRALRAGDVLREGDVVVTSAGGRVELAFGDGTILPVEQQQTIAIHADMSETTRSDGQDAQVSSGTIDKVIQALNDGGSLDDVEAPAAGMSGGGASESHDFVRLLRVAEGGDPLAFEYSTNRTSELDDRFGLAPATDAGATLAPEPVTTTPPTIEPPTTQPPTIEPPTTQPPTTEPPTQEPTTAPPVTQPPATLPPGGGPTLPPDGTITPPPVTEPPATPPPGGIVPAAAPAGVTGTEDTDYTFTWSNFNVSDADSPPADLGIKITSVPADGTLLLNGVAVSIGTAISKADIDAGKLVFRPDPNESGSGAFGNPGVGNKHDDYAQFNFKPTDATHEGAEATMNIDITPVADMPTLDATAGAATPAGATVTYPITITSALTDTDGSETLSAPTVSSIPVGVTLSDGVHTFTAAGGSTSVTLTGWDLTNLTLTAPAGQADFTLNVAVTSTETGGSTATATDSIFIDMPTVNQPPAAAPAGVTGTEDTDYTFTWSNFGVTDADSPAADLSIKITSLPVNGELVHADGTPVLAGETFTKAAIDAGDLVFRPDPNESGSSAFGNPGVGNKHDDYAQFNFKPTDATHEGAEATMNIDITPVADMPTLDATAGAATPAGATVTYPITITSALTDTDGSETLSAPTVSSIPVGVTLSDGVHTFTAAGGSTSVTLTGWDLTNLTLTAPAGQADFTLNVAVTSTETGGSTATATDSIFIDLPTVNQPPAATPIGVKGLEDTDYTFTWSSFGVTDADSPVTDLGIKITSLPADGTLYLDGVAVAANQAVSKADIDAGKLVFRPELHESGIDGFGGAGVGNKQADYARFDFKPTDATNEGTTATMKIDIAPVADAPTLTVSLGAAVPVSSTTTTTGDIDWNNVLTPGNGVTVTAQKFVDLGGGSWGLSAPDASNIAIYNASGAAILNHYGLNWIGVQGRAPGAPDNTAGSNAQIAYSYDAHASEALIFDFGDIDVTKVSFNVDRLLFDELTGKPGNQTAVMVYELWNNGVMVSTAEIVAENNATGEFASDKIITWASGFDKIVFKAADHFDGMTEAASMALSKDGSDYCITKLDYEGTRSGVGKYEYALGIHSSLVDTDGSETLSTPTISNIPIGAVLSDGVHTFTGTAGSGSVTLTGWDLDNLTVISPDSSTDFSLVVSVHSTETVNGDSALTSRVVDVVVGTVDGVAPSVTLAGGSGEDHLVGGKGDDIIAGGAGDDDLWGGLGADTFVWHLADRGAPGLPAVDTVHDFDNTANSDRLDLKDLLQGEHDTGLAFNLDKYLFVEQQGADTVVHVSSQGQFSSGFDAAKEDQKIVLQSIDLTGGLADQTQIIQQMLINGKLITDH